MTLGELSISHIHILDNRNTPGNKNDFTQLPRPFTSVAYMLEGVMEFNIGERCVTVRAGDIIFVPRGATYHSTCIEASHYISIYLTMELFGGRLCKYIIERIDGDGLREDFVILCKQLEAKPGTLNTSSDRLTLESMSRIYRILADVRPKLHTTAVKQPDPRIAAAIEKLDSSFTEPLKVAELAEMCHLSVSHFHALFVAQLGMTPIEYKNRAAISYAERLLCEDRHSIEHIGAMCGFSSGVYFRRVFRSFTAMSPREYRKYSRLLL